jgi:AcrR family transcriptional regulator
MAAKPRTAPRKSAKQDRSRATVEAILRATAHILVRDGYDRASTNRIAEAAGVSIGSLYQYFPSKEALVAELLDRHCAEILALLQESAATHAFSPLAEAVRHVVAAMVRAHRINATLHRVLFEQVPRIGRLDQLAALDRRSAGLVKAYLDAHAGELRVRDTELAAIFVVKTVEALTHLMVFDYPPRPDVEGEIADVVLRYLAKDSPAKVARAEPPRGRARDLPGPSRARVRTSGTSGP